MNKVARKVQDARTSAECEISGRYKALALVGLLEETLGQFEESLAVLYVWPNRIYLGFMPGTDAALCARVIRRAMRARVSQRDFNQYDGSVKYSTESPEGVTVIVEVTKPTTRCAIKAVEEEVHVPAHTEKRVKYVLENPEECLGVAENGG